ncbi:hypothetical protein CcaverHIS002_0203440 [Cutaneotrichosporon cavernicola]|uniref:Saccharopine dehydrogenase NADP binding domain-containing protein n=1 Tax=Cutaneotrichosporon cavernicola TaxID=279322 RepID=A0AA48IDG4_9TREE|nr:uncharacterized protein CcaverHIS019_0203430 [Cutaneotrichosporon cavernicola]BEI81184.1 hypothetical protein CcaverHIS002_0203440 [Cutaneotrichosporon cavernicola]BEI88981.1 hypothetical protein CcaverHIS019_0203430 [Cutaneotrichosporon cavernicola]BEI96757.1 hypothetical protein CcaverHIS631_0203460 [Cutaneotrichosporon cavernicola]BEJ04529.1 hypothetical protein CcaverHIS641_0203460 [Cutaneotrichosporon cavernicola]
MPKSHTPTLVVYGSTSYTAQQHLLPYLASHPDADAFHLILAGRSAEKLAAVDALLPKREREIVAVKLNDQGGVESLCKRADVVLNLAGPYQLHNATALISACVKHSTHYLDLCGEPNFLARIVPNYDFAASKTGAVIIPMCGFEAAPGDLNIYHALRTLQAHAGRETTIAAATNFYDIAGGVSGGTMASIAASSVSGDKMEGEWCLVPKSWSGHQPEHPSLQLALRPPVQVAGAPSIGGWFPGSMLNVMTFRRSWFLSRMSPVVYNEAPEAAKADQYKEPRHGDDAVFAEAMTYMAPLRVTGLLTAYLYGGLLLLFLGLYSSAAWMRDALAQWIPQPGEGPTKEECERGHTRITTVSRSNDGRYAVITKYAAGGDPGYSHTGKLLAEAGLSLLLPPPEGTELPALARTGGFLTPSTGLGMVVIERMRRNGIATVDSEVVELGRPGEHKKQL